MMGMSGILSALPDAEGDFSFTFTFNAFYSYKIP